MLLERSITTLLRVSWSIITSLNCSNFLLPIFALASFHIFYQTIFPLLLFPLNVVYFKVIFLVLLYSICSLIHSSNSLDRKSITSLVPLLIVKTTTYSFLVCWFQFIDDAAVMTTNERENQLLLKCSLKWCQWASMIICVDKCATFWD